MKENGMTGNVEIQSYLIYDTKFDKENNKEKYSPQLISSTDDNKLENNNIFNDDDSNLLLNYNTAKGPTGIFKLKLYLNPNQWLQLFKMTKMGKSFGFFYDQNDDPLVIVGPQWHYCIFLLIISTLAFAFIYRYFNNNSTTFIKISDWIIFGIWALSYIYICIKNPGYPQMSTESIRGTKEMSYCDKCEIWHKPTSNTIHCEICDICIEGYTHHCFIIGHCIGINNKKAFYFFLIISFIFPIYLIINISIIAKRF